MHQRDRKLEYGYNTRRANQIWKSYTLLYLLQTILKRFASRRTTKVKDHSPITGKYYLQFNSNYLIDIIRQAVRDIIIYDASLSDLVISELQKEIFLIYDNTNISVGEL